MSRSEIYYSMPASIAKNFIPGILKLVEDHAHEGLYPKTKEPLEERTKALLDKVLQLDDEEECRLTANECILFFHLLTNAKLLLNSLLWRIERSEAEGRMTEELASTVEPLELMSALIDEKMEELAATFEVIRIRLAEVKRDFRDIELRKKTLGADNVETVIHFQATESLNLSFLVLIFEIFDIMILKNDYGFSGRVREADFFSLLDFEEVREKVNSALDNQMTSIDLTMRDAVVIYMVSNIMQKLYFTDAGDAFMNIFETVTAFAGIAAESKNVRNSCLRLAAQLNEAIVSDTENIHIFNSFTKPVNEFSV